MWILFCGQSWCRAFSGLVECVWKSGCLCLELDNFFPALLAPTSYLKWIHFIKHKVVKFASKCFQVFEWQPIRKAKCYYFQNSCPWCGGNIIFTCMYSHLGFWVKKQRKLFSPLNFPVEGVIFYWNNEGSCQQRRVICLCQVNQGLKWQRGIVRPLPWAGTWAESLQSLTALPPPAVSHLSPTIRG